VEIYDWLDQEGYSSVVPQVRNASTYR